MASLMIKDKADDTPAFAAFDALFVSLYIFSSYIFKSRKDPRDLPFRSYTHINYVKLNQDHEWGGYQIIKEWYSFHWPARREKKRHAQLTYYNSQLTSVSVFLYDDSPNSLRVDMMPESSIVR